MKRMRLLNPGPVTLTERVRNSLLREDLCHREPEFSELMADVRRRLVSVYESTRKYDSIILTGSGTGAVEAMVGSFVPADRKCLVVSNGVYGERVCSMLKAQGKPYDVVESDWLEGIDIAQTGRKLASGEKYSYVIAIHHETTTGRLNRIDELGELCKRHDVPMLLDAVSSFAGEHIDYDNWNIAACAATANKCLHGVPGIAFVVARADLFDKGSTNATSVYLDLFKYRDLQNKGSIPFTQSVHVMYALQEALREFEDQGGINARNEKYRKLTTMVKEGFLEMGITLLLDPSNDETKDYSSILTSYRLPGKLTYDRIHDHLKNDGFVIYAGQGNLAREIFRISTMGDIDEKDMNELLKSMKKLLA